MKLVPYDDAQSIDCASAVSDVGVNALAGTAAAVGVGVCLGLAPANIAGAALVAAAFTAASSQKKAG